MNQIQIQNMHYDYHKMASLPSSSFNEESRILFLHIIHNYTWLPPGLKAMQEVSSCLLPQKFHHLFYTFKTAPKQVPVSDGFDFREITKDYVDDQVLQ